MNTEETRKSDAIRFINTVAKANKMLDKDYESLNEIGVYSLTNKHLYIDKMPECQLSDIRKLATLVDIPLLELEVSGTYPVYRFFDYKGTRFFSLYKKGE